MSIFFQKKNPIHLPEKQYISHRFSSSEKVPILSPLGPGVPGDLGSAYRTTLDYFKLRKLYECEQRKAVKENCEGLITGMQGELRPRQDESVCTLRIVVAAGYVIQFHFHVFPVRGVEC